MKAIPFIVKGVSDLRLLDSIICFLRDVLSPSLADIADLEFLLIP